jgi:methylthioribulose-1-phosphate dehydratase
MNPWLENNEMADTASNQKPNIHASIIESLIAAGKLFYSRNWLLGNAGEFSAVVSQHPFVLAMTAMGSRKERLSQQDFLLLDQLGQPVDPMQQAPSEMPIHRAIIAERDAGAIVHTTSVWSVLLSDLYAECGGFPAEGFVTLRALPQVCNREHQEWLPILCHSEEFQALSEMTVEVLRAQPAVHGILFRKHGLYSWGKNVEEAVQNIEIFELLFEVHGRQLHILKLGANE